MSSQAVAPQLLTFEDLSEIVALSWSTLTNQVAELVAEPSAAATDCITASVAIAGTWAGTVVIACPRSLARLAASGMFGLAVDDLDEGDVLDAMGEIANVVGGSVKGMASGFGDCTLSLPIVSDGHQVVPGSHALVCVAFDCSGAVFTCEVREQG